MKFYGNWESQFEIIFIPWNFLFWNFSDMAHFITTKWIDVDADAHLVNAFYFRRWTFWETGGIPEVFPKKLLLKGSSHIRGAFGRVRGPWIMGPKIKTNLFSCCLVNKWSFDKKRILVGFWFTFDLIFLIDHKFHSHVFTLGWISFRIQKLRIVWLMDCLFMTCLFVELDVSN